MISDCQVPGPGEVFLDHVGWFAADLTTTATLFERLGFTLTPPVAHSNTSVDGHDAPSGTANQCAMLEQGYLEILTAVPGSETPLARQLRTGLMRHQGVHLIAFAAADAAVERVRLAKAGFDPDPVVHLHRPIAMEGGGQAIASFRVVRVPPSSMPEGRVQLLVQETPELVWQSQLIARANVVAALTGILLVVADPIEAAERYARYSGREARAIRDGGAVIVLDRGRIALIGPGLPWVFPGAVPPSPPVVAIVALRSNDLATSRHYMVSRGIRLAADAVDHFIVHPDEAAGAALLIHADGADDCLHER